MVRISRITLKQDAHEIILGEPVDLITNLEAGEKIKLHIRSRITTPIDISPRSSIIGIVVIPEMVPIDLKKFENVTMILDTSEGKLSIPVFPTIPSVMKKDHL
jgi:hypothetical protein